MSRSILDINDATLSAWQGEKCVLQSPGYALLQGQAYSFGEEAKNEARRNPRQVNHRFWSTLDMEPLTPAFGPGRHSADLVHAHLLDIHARAGQPGEFIIAAPASLQHEQLALLLGIIEQCPFNAVGLVDRAVAALAGQAVSGYNWHVELQLHQALVTGVRAGSGEISREQALPIPGAGWLGIQENLARVISASFIRQTRFDPRRQAATEQSLFDRIPALLDSLTEAGEADLEFNGHRARIERSQLAQACKPVYDRLQQVLSSRDGQVFLGPTAARLPGIHEQLSGAANIGDSAIAGTIHARQEAICGGDEGLHFVTLLPCEHAQAATRQDEAAPVSTAAQPEPAASTRCHITIDNGQLTLRPESGPGPRVNGELVERDTPLRDGDTLSLESGETWRLVAVAADADGNDGAQT